MSGLIIAALMGLGLSGIYAFIAGLYYKEFIKKGDN